MVDVIEKNNIAKQAAYAQPEQKAETTRQRILQAGFEEMYENGYQGMRIDAVLAKTGLAKGALYHHFPNKKALGYAIVDDLLSVQAMGFLDFLASIDDPIEANQAMLKKVIEVRTEKDIYLGCPVNNLAQEMAGLDEGFKERLSRIYDHRVQTIADSIFRGQAKGFVRRDVDAYMSAAFMVSSYNGIIGAAKCTGDIKLYRALIATLADYVASLSPHPEKYTNINSLS